MDNLTVWSGIGAALLNSAPHHVYLGWSIVGAATSGSLSSSSVCVLLFMCLCRSSLYTVDMDFHLPKLVYSSNQLLALKTKSRASVVPHLTDEVGRPYHGCRAGVKLAAVSAFLTSV